MKLRTKLLALLLCTAMLLSLLPAGTLQVSAYSETDIAYPVEGGNIYFDKATGTITDCDDTVTSADIPAEIDGVAVTSIGDSAFSSCYSLTSVTIPNSVTNIGNGAFFGCSSLTIVTIPNSVTSIGDSAFFNCSSLKSLTLPYSLTSIGNDAFHWCSSLLSVTIPDSVISIGNYAFYDCGLTNVTFGNSITSIGFWAFNSCDNLVHVFYTGTEEQWNAIDIKYGNYDLTAAICHYEVTGNELKIIGETCSCFIACCSICDCNIYLNKIRAHNYLDGICENCGAPNYLYYTIDRDFGTIAVTGYDGSVVDVVIPNTIEDFPITSIAASAFDWCDSLGSVTIPDSVTSIGNFAFAYCSNLESVTIGSSVSDIGCKAFNYCANLQRFNANEENEDYYTDDNGVLFSRVRGALIQVPSTYANSYTVPANVNYILYSAVQDCAALDQLTILNPTCTLTGLDVPDNLTLHGTEGSTAQKYAEENGVSFTIHSSESDCAYCEGKQFGQSGTCGDNLTWSFNAMSGELVIAGDGAMDSFSCVPPWDLVRNEITSVILPEGLTSIGSLAFENCVNLTEILIPNSVETIEENAFLGCENLKSVDFGSGITRIERQAFALCNSLELVELPSAISYIGENAFCTYSDVLTGVAILNADCEIFASAETLGNPEWTTIYGVAGSTAQSYAEEWDYEFVVIDVEEPSEPSEEPSEPSEEPSEPSEEPTEPSEEPSEPSEEPSEPSEEPSEPSEELTEPSEEPTEPSEEPSEPSEQPTEPSEEPSEPSEQPTEPSEEPTEPSEEPSEPSEEPSEPSEPEIPTENPFTDVKESDYFATPVLWAVGKNITNGMSATSFAPNENCTRGQIVTFLWRACGSPEPTSTKNNFKDVKAGEYYYKAVLWAVENGITTGLSATTFGPNATCTRGQVATFLWRSQGEPAPTSTNNPFSDVKTSDYYFKAVLWAVENDVTQGVGNGKFTPNDSCTRGQIVTFLYRAIA